LIAKIYFSDLYRLNTLIADLDKGNLQRKTEIMNSLDAKGITPLMACAIDDFELGAALLMENGVDINIHNHDEKCALTMAVLHGNENMISFLISHGANVAVKGPFYIFLKYFHRAPQGMSAKVAFMLGAPLNFWKYLF
jgi:ankyrin repeat protein